MSSLKFSCLISSYIKDSPEQLKACLNSLKEQTLKADEIVIVKDGILTKELDEIILNFSKILPIKIVQIPENKGLGNALHQGLISCSYNHVFRMDTDDICMKDRFKKQIKFFKENPKVDIVGSWAYDIDKSGKVIGERKMPTQHKDLYNLIWTCPLIHPTVAFKRDSIIRIGSYNTKIKRRQDYDLWFRAASNNLEFANVPEFLLKYRFTDDFYKKNNFKVALQQTKMGLKGLVSLKSISPIAYLGVISPLLRAVFPKFVAIWIHKIFKKVDPRKKIQ